MIKRANQLNDLAQTETADFILCARGGYGCSELFETLDWEDPQKKQASLVGFSDISALHCARYALNGLSGIHGPMIGSAIWKLQQP